MKITGILHKAGTSLNDLFGKLERASEYSDIVIAPDYALAENLDKPLGAAEFSGILGRLGEISRESGAMLIPGTAPVVNEDRMHLVCPVFAPGFDSGVQLLKKETDRGEAALAERNGLTYVRGDCNLNNVPYDGRNVAVEICSDHGHQVVPRGTFLEAILAFDKNAGFWVRPMTPKFERNIIVCDSYQPMVEASHMSAEGKVELVKPIEQNEERRMYEIK